MYNIIDLTKLKPASYRRKSSEGEDRQALSLPSQQEELKRIKEYHKIPDFLYDFEDAKSAKIEKLRPSFNLMWEKIHRKEIDSIVCWKLDRLARNMTEGGMLIDALSSGLLKAIITYDKVWYPTDNVLAMSVEFGQNKQYVKDLSTNVKRGQRTKAGNGLPQGLAALGYLNSKQGDKGTRWWYVDEERFWKIKKLFELFLSGKYSVGKLHRHAVDELKLDTPMRKKLGGHYVTLANLYKILKNPIYAGFFFVQGEKYQLDKNLPTMINERQYNQLLQMITNKHRPKIQQHESLYSGFLVSDAGDCMGQDVKYQLKCDCGHKFSYRAKVSCPRCKNDIDKLNNPEYYIKHYYYNNRKKKAREDYKSIEEATVDTELLNFFGTDFVLPAPLLNWSKEYIVELKNKTINDGLKVIEDKEKRKLDYDRKKMRMREMLRDCTISDFEYKTDLEALENTYKDLSEDRPTVNWSGRMDEIVDMMSCAIEVFQNGSNNAKREVLSKIGSNLIWNDEKLLINNSNSIKRLIEGTKSINSYLSKFEQDKTLVEQGLNPDYDMLHLTLRKRRDSNSRTDYSVSCFQDRCIRPLCHSSSFIILT